MDACETTEAIAVIGQGYSGTAVALHLLRSLPAGAQLLLFERGSRPGRGMAYGTVCDSHLLNVPAGRLGWDPADESGFVRWLAEMAPWHHSADFVPRRLYGDYLQSHLTAATALARARGVVVQTGLPGVRDLQRCGGQWALRLDDGRTMNAAQVVLASGHLPPQRPSLGPDADWSRPGLWPDPWADTGWARLPPQADVLLLGSGLTAIDVFNQLREQGHQGHITMLSRRGLLPQPHRALEARPRPGLSPVVELGPDLRLRAVLRAVRVWVAQADEVDGREWRDVLASLRSCTPTLWQRLSLRDRAQFLRHLQPWWDSHRHRLAPALWQRVRAERALGRLTHYAGRVRSVVPSPLGRWHVSWQPRGGGPLLSGQVAAVINCTGPSSALRTATEPLLQALRHRGVLQPDQLGLGLLIDEQHRPLDGSGVAAEGLFYLGPMLKARYWEAIAVPELRQHAAQVAASVLGSRVIAAALSA
ncbi:FAD/NAD(P)-binding protein [Ideonella sp.]|uniref:FAD/NAD(P)-binding protein n=1 Tax=Ideonella sp. TaxID=1929293 RepID=UPI003BB5BF85